MADDIDDAVPIPMEPEFPDPADDIERPDGTTPADDHEAAAEAEAEATAEAEADDDQAEEFDNPHGITATYSPEDNKLRLYAAERLPRALYEEVKAAGFAWAPKQGLFVAPRWTPAREDFALRLAGDIGDEAQSLTERAADRAERFEGYREKRTAEALGHADTFEAGPQAFGHQSRARAERQARRHDRHRGRAVSQWSKAEYWTERTAGVIRNALFRTDPRTRRGRILTLEAEERKERKALDAYAVRFAAWEKVYTLDGADQAGRYVREVDGNGWTTGQGFAPETVTPALRAAYALANYGGGYGEYAHPRTGRRASLYSLLTDEADPITPAEAARLWLHNRRNPADPNSQANRWADHYRNRLAYERAQLEAEGGSADAADIEPGGWVRIGRRTGSVFTDVSGGWMQVHAVTRSPATRRVTSVKVMGTRSRTGYNPSANDAVAALVSVNVQRLPADAYRAPTEEERAAFLTATAEAKKAKKAATPKGPPLLNPTNVDAEQLQRVLNEHVAAVYARGDRRGPAPVSEVVRMTQKEYSERSKGTSPVASTSDITERLTIGGGRDRGRVVVFKVRTMYGGGGLSLTARRVVILTDKPQQPLPFAEARRVAELQPTAAGLAPRWPLIIAGCGFNATEEERRLYEDAGYLGWTADTRYEVRGLTAAGRAAYEEWKKAPPPAPVPVPDDDDDQADPDEPSPTDDDGAEALAPAEAGRLF